MMHAVALTYLNISLLGYVEFKVYDFSLVVESYRGVSARAFEAFYGQTTIGDRQYLFNQIGVGYF